MEQDWAQIFGEDNYLSWEDVKDILKTISEERLIQVYSKIVVLRSQDMLEKLFNYSLLTSGIIEVINRITATIPLYKNFRNKYKIGIYSEFHILLGRFAIAFGALNVLPDKELYLETLLEQKLKRTLYNPYLIAIPQRVLSVIKWILKRVEYDLDLCLELSRGIPEIKQFFLKMREEREKSVLLPLSLVKELLEYAPYELSDYIREQYL